MIETDPEFGAAHDRWLAAYASHDTTVYCPNRKCPNRDGVVVLWESEYGQPWITPETCHACGADLVDEPKEDDDDDDDDG